MITIKISVPDAKAFAAKVERATKALQNRTKPHGESKKYLTSRWEDNFLTEGGIYREWPALAARTQDIRSWMGFGAAGPKLRRWDDLLANVRGQNEAGEVGPDVTSWAFENTEPGWPLSHQFGINVPVFNATGQDRQPPRVIWMVNGDDALAVGERFDNYVRSVIARYF